MLEALHPGRVDLGIGRAPGHRPGDGGRAAAHDDLGAEDFPRDLLDLMGLLGDERVEHGAWSRFRATPAATSRPQIVLLGSSGYSAQVAGQLGLGFGFAHHFDTGGVLQACELYRESFRPSAELAEPYTIVTAGVLAADDPEQAEYLAGPARLAILGIRTNRRTPLLPPDEAAVHPDIEIARSMPSTRIVDDGPSAVRRLIELAEQTQATELMISTMTYGLPERIHTLELLAEHWPVVAVDDVTTWTTSWRWPSSWPMPPTPSTLPPFQARQVTYDWKANHTEVTALDRAAERVIADRLAAERPTHRFLGEEFGTAGDPASPWRWIVDPIDGTSGYVRGIPVWATLIALEHGADGVVVAVVSAPALGRRWWASAGGGCVADGRPCRVSTVDAIADAQVSITLNDGLGRPRADAGARRPGPGGPTGARASATSGSTASSPRARWTSPSTPSGWRPTTSPPCACSSRRRVGRSPTATAS